jgi:hypothetical protein
MKGLLDFGLRIESGVAPLYIHSTMIDSWAVIDVPRVSGGLFVTRPNPAIRLPGEFVIEYQWLVVSYRVTD